MRDRINIAAIAFGLALATSPPAHAAALSDDLWTRDTLSGNWGGLRDRLSNAGVEFSADSNDEILGNVSGGLRRAFVYDGRFEVATTIDLEKALGWHGATFHANAYWTHNHGLSA